LVVRTFMKWQKQQLITNTSEKTKREKVFGEKNPGIVLLGRNSVIIRFFGAENNIFCHRTVPHGQDNTA